MKLTVKEQIAKILRWINAATDYFNCDQLCSGSYTSGTVTLSKSIANYKKLFIVARDNDGYRKTFVLINNGASSIVTYLDFVRITGAWYAKSMLLSFNGKTVSIQYNCQAHASGTGSGSYVYLEKIYGCRLIAGGGTA